MKDLRCRHAVDILCFPVCLDQGLIPGHMGKYAQLDLGIIRIHKYKSFSWNKYFSDQSSQFHTNGDILQIGFCTADPSCSSNGLIEGRMNPSVFSDKDCQTVCISGFQFCQLPVLQNICHQFMIRCQFFQYFRSCGIAGFRFLASWQLQFFKQNHPQLFWRIDIKGFTRFFINFFFQFPDPDLKLISVFF